MAKIEGEVALSMSILALAEAAGWPSWTRNAMARLGSSRRERVRWNPGENTGQYNQRVNQWHLSLAQEVTLREVLQALEREYVRLPSDGKFFRMHRRTLELIAALGFTRLELLLLPQGTINCQMLQGLPREQLLALDGRLLGTIPETAMGRYRLRSKAETGIVPPPFTVGELLRRSPAELYLSPRVASLTRIRLRELGFTPADGKFLVAEKNESVDIPLISVEELWANPAAAKAANLRDLAIICKWPRITRNCMTWLGYRQVGNREQEGKAKPGRREEYNQQMELLSQQVTVGMVIAVLEKDYLLLDPLKYGYTHRPLLLKLAAIGLSWMDSFALFPAKKAWPDLRQIPRPELLTLDARVLGTITPHRITKWRKRVREASGVWPSPPTIQELLAYSPEELYLSPAATAATRIRLRELGFTLEDGRFFSEKEEAVEDLPALAANLLPPTPLAAKGMNLHALAEIFAWPVSTRNKMAWLGYRLREEEEPEGGTMAGREKDKRWLERLAKELTLQATVRALEKEYLALDPRRYSYTHRPILLKLMTVGLSRLHSFALLTPKKEQPNLAQIPGRELLALDARLLGTISETRMNKYRAWLQAASGDWPPPYTIGELLAHPPAHHYLPEPVAAATRATLQRLGFGSGDGVFMARGQ